MQSRWNADRHCARALPPGKRGWPESLAQLEPRFLASVPADPFDGKPFKYLLRPEGPLVYSIGADEDDDGGVPPPGRMGNVGASRWRRNVQNAPNGDFVAWPTPPEPKRASGSA
jgi:hypothetical protein